MRIHITQEGLENLIRVELKKQPRVIKETLSRMGVGNSKTRSLHQVCYLVEIAGVHYIVHFKEIYGLLGKDINWRETDIPRRNKLARLLEQWELIEILSDQIDFSYNIDSRYEDEDDSLVYRIRHQDRGDYELKNTINILNFYDVLADYNYDNGYRMSKNKGEML